MQPLQPRNPLQPGDENKHDFRRYHQWVHHPTNRCRIIMEKIQKMLDNNEIEYEELPKRQAATNMVFITNKNFSFAATPEDEVDEPNDAENEINSLPLHDTNLGDPQGSLNGGITSSQDPVQADLRTSSQDNPLQGILSETVPSNEIEIAQPGAVLPLDEMK